MIFAVLIVFIPVVGIMLYFASRFSKGEGFDMISGFSTMSEERKARYDREAVAKFTGRLMYVLTALMGLFFTGLALFEEFYRPLMLIWILFIAVAISGYVYIHKSRRFRV